MELVSLRQENKLLKDFKTEKEKFVKTIKNLNATIAGHKAELEKKTKQIRDLQRLNMEQKQNPKNDGKNNNAGNNNAAQAKVYDKEKEKAIRMLEAENMKLRNEIIKLNDGMMKRTSNNLAKFEEALNNNKDILQTNNLLISGNSNIKIKKI